MNLFNGSEIATLRMPSMRWSLPGQSAALGIPLKWASFFIWRKRHSKFDWIGVQLSSVSADLHRNWQNVCHQLDLTRWRSRPSVWLAEYFRTWVVAKIHPAGCLRRVDAFQTRFLTNRRISTTRAGWKITLKKHFNLWPDHIQVFGYPDANSWIVLVYSTLTDEAMKRGGGARQTNRGVPSEAWDTSIGVSSRPCLEMVWFSIVDMPPHWLEKIFTIRGSAERFGMFGHSACFLLRPVVFIESGSSCPTCPMVDPTVFSGLNDALNYRYCQSMCPGVCQLVSDMNT